MLRPTLLVVALSCALACMSYGQQPSSTQTTPSTPAAGQSAPPQTAMPADTKPAPPATNVPMSDPVITLKGACAPKNGAAPKGCVSSLTREDFEKLINALQPPDKGPVPPEIRRRFATQYAKLLTMADAARELGLENDPKVQEIFRFAQNQILAERLNAHYMEEFSHPTDQQIQEYYDKNTKKYHEATLQRIIVPVMQQTAEKDKPAPPSEAEQKAYVEKIRQRWAAGEDPVKLQKEAMEHTGNTTGAPDVNVGARRPGTLPEAHDPVFELKPGEVSQVYSDPAAYYIYKVLSERQIPLSEVKPQITQTLQRDNFSDKIKQIEAATTPQLNDAYFGPEAPPQTGPQIIGPGGRPGPPGRPGMPPPGAGTPPPPPAQNTGTSPK